MKQLKSLNFVFLFLLSSIYSIAQLTLGEATLSYVKAKPLLRTERIVTAVKSLSYLGKVGGIAFDKVAVPSDGLYVSNLKLSYNPILEDGKRFSIIINGNKAEVNIFDWELVPIAKYANSTHTACFTLFGELEDGNKASSIRQNGGKVLNYHPELVNTLLGLRLFQLDILIIEPNLSIYLPKNAGEYVLGQGETSPNISNNRTGFWIYQSAFKKSKEKYSSYLICDQNRSIKFSVQNNSLTITGEPFYYFWKYKEVPPSYNESLLKSITNDMAKVMQQGWTESEQNNLLEKWLLTKIKNEYAITYGPQSQSEYEVFLKAAKSAKEKKEMMEYLRELTSTLYQSKIENNKQIIYLSNLSTTLSNQPSLFRNINPCVWDAGIKTMRYSAFFRYCKINFPEEWKTFISQVKRIEILPTVETPSVLTLSKSNN